LVKSFWIPFDTNLGLSSSEKFVASLNMIKVKVVEWAIEKHKKKDICLAEVQFKLSSLFHNKLFHTISEEEDRILKDLECLEKKLLLG